MNVYNSKYGLFLIKMFQMWGHLLLFRSDKIMKNEKMDNLIYKSHEELVAYELSLKRCHGKRQSSTIIIALRLCFRTACNKIIIIAEGVQHSKYEMQFTSYRYDM